MEQHNGTGMDTTAKLLKGLLMAGLGILVPVHIGQAPEKGGIPHVLGHLQVGSAVFPLGRPVVHGQFSARDFPEFVPHGIHLLLEGGLV